MFFLVQVKRTNGTVIKGVVVKDTLDDAEQSYYAYLGAYAFGHEESTDYVFAQVINGDTGLAYETKVWVKAVEEPVEETGVEA